MWANEGEAVDSSLLGCMPNEIALHVLSYLGPREVCIIATLCRHWHKLSLDSALWRSLYLRSEMYRRELRRQEFSHLSRDTKLLLQGLSCTAPYPLTSSSGQDRLRTEPQSASADTAGRDWRGTFMYRCKMKQRWLSGGYAAHTTLKARSAVYAIKYDEDKLVCGTQDSHIRVFDRKTWKNTLTLSGHRDWIVSCSGDMHIRVWNWEGECTNKIKGHTGWVKRLQYNDEVLVTSSGDKTVKVWRWSDTSEAASTLIGHTDGVMGLQFMDHTIVSGSLDGTICVWDTDTGSCLNTIRNIDKGDRFAEVRCLMFDRDEIVSGGSDCQVKIWDRATGQLRRVLAGHHGFVKYVYFDDYKIVSGSADGSIRVWDCRGTTDAALYTIMAHSRDIINMDVHENSFASGSLEDTVKMWVIQ